MSSCNCKTIWGTREFRCARGYELNITSVNDTQRLIDEFINSVSSILVSRGSISKETFWTRIPTPPGTSTPLFKLISRYCTSDNWFQFRNFKLTIKLDGKPISENMNDNRPESEDLTDLVSCEYPPFWIGYWWIKDKTCNCVGPTPESPPAGGALRGITFISKRYTGASKTVSKYLDLRADWEEQSGRICGDEVDANASGVVPPPDLSRYWRSKYKTGGKYINLRYDQEEYRFAQEIDTFVIHNCS